MASRQWSRCETPCPPVPSLADRGVVVLWGNVGPAEVRGVGDEDVHHRLESSMVYAGVAVSDDGSVDVVGDDEYDGLGRLGEAAFDLGCVEEAEGEARASPKHPRPS